MTSQSSIVLIVLSSVPLMEDRANEYNQVCDVTALLAFLTDQNFMSPRFPAVLLVLTVVKIIEGMNLVIKGL